MAFASTVLIAAGCATEPSMPPGAATPELAVQAGVSEQLGMPVVLHIATFSQHDGWAFLAGQPLTRKGEHIDYGRTSYAEEIAQGYFDDNFAALVRHSTETGAGWHLMELSIGATDAPFVGWFEQHGLPMSMAATE